MENEKTFMGRSAFQGPGFLLVEVSFKGTRKKSRDPRNWRRQKKKLPKKKAKKSITQIVDKGIVLGSNGRPITRDGQVIRGTLELSYEFDIGWEELALEHPHKKQALVEYLDRQCPLFKKAVAELGITRVFLAIISDVVWWDFERITNIRLVVRPAPGSGLSTEADLARKGVAVGDMCSVRTPCAVTARMQIGTCTYARWYKANASGAVLDPGAIVLVDEITMHGRVRMAHVFIQSDTEYELRQGWVVAAKLKKISNVLEEET